MGGGSGADLIARNEIFISPLDVVVMMEGNFFKMPWEGGAGGFWEADWGGISLGKGIWSGRTRSALRTSSNNDKK